MTETRDGKRRATEDAPARRVIEAAWVEGVDQRPIYHPANPDPEYVAIKVGGNPIAARGDQPTVLEGLIRRLGGARVPLVYIPRIDDAPAGDKTLLAGQESLVLARVISSSSRETVLGDENRDEVVRLSGLTLSEEV